MKILFRTTCHSAYLAVAIFLLTSGQMLIAQTPVTSSPKGSRSLSSFPTGSIGVMGTTNSVTLVRVGTPTIFETWRSPDGIEIEWLAPKTGSDEIVLVLLTNGSVVGLNLNNFKTTGKFLATDATQLGKLQGGTFADLAGDAIYARSFVGQVMVSRDNAKTWQLDSAGLGNNSSVLSLALDSLQYVYAGLSQKGLFKQHPDSSVWHRVDSLYYTNFLHQKFYPTVDRVYIDRRNRLWVDAYGAIGAQPFVSTDNGLTWRNDTTGMGGGYALAFGDDRYGNDYAVVQSNGLTNFYGIYKTTDIGHTWKRIDLPLTAMIGGTSAGSNPFLSVGGDSLIFVATPFGMFQSSDQGTTWAEANQGIPAENIYSMAKTSSGRTLMSTDLGIFRQNKNDTVWAKTYPVNGYFGARPLLQDGVGNFYTMGNLIASTQYFIYKSTDEGATWNPDTAGIQKSAGNGAFFIDETGAQHTVTPQGSPSKTNIAVKPLNGSWQPDTSAFSAFTSTQHGTAFISDGAGFLYLTGVFNRGNMWRRPIGGGNWVLDTTGLNSRTVSALYRGRNGEVFAIASNGFGQTILLRRSAGVWSAVAPALIGASPMVVSIDSTSAIFVAFSTFNPGNFTVTSNGVYFLAKDSVSWTYAGLKDLTVNNLVSYGDSTYALTQGNGGYLLRHQKALGVATKGFVPASYSLSQNYPNPFNPSTHLQYAISNLQFVKLKVFDVLGREVTTLVNEQKGPGTYTVEWNASGFASGMYFYRLEAGTFVDVKKMLLLK